MIHRYFVHMFDWINSLIDWIISKNNNPNELNQVIANKVCLLINIFFFDLTSLFLIFGIGYFIRIRTSIV